MNTSQICFKAAEWIKQHKWIKGRLFRRSNGTFTEDPNEAGMACAVGVLEIICREYGVSTQEVRVVIDKYLWANQLELQFMSRYFSGLPSFNDHVDTTEEDVISVFESVGRLEEKKAASVEMTEKLDKAKLSKIHTEFQRLGS